MLRSIWIMISTLAIANLLALIGLVGWLHSTDRLDADRVQRLREMLSVTISSERAEAEQKLMLAQAAEEQAKSVAQVGKNPTTAEDKLEAAAVREEVETQRARRVQRETSDLINTLMREREELERQREEFQNQMNEFEAMRTRIAEEEGSEQFQKTVQLYQSVKAVEAKNMMRSLIGDGHTDQVVSYLNALPPRNASKIVSEFQAEDPDLAADLLEKLRMRGTAVAPPNTGGANQPVAAAPPEG